MNKLKLLIVEGNTKEENVNFGNAGCVPQSQNFKKHLQKIEPNSEIDIVEPIDDNSISKIISSLKKYDGVVLTGSTLRLNEDIAEVKKHIDFAKTCFRHEKKFDLDKLSQMALDDPSTGGNPKKLSKSDMKIMYEHSLSGKLF